MFELVLLPSTRSSFPGAKEPQLWHSPVYHRQRLVPIRSERVPGSSSSTLSRILPTAHISRWLAQFCSSDGCLPGVSSLPFSPFAVSPTAKKSLQPSAIYGWRPEPSAAKSVLSRCPCGSRTRRKQRRCGERKPLQKTTHRRKRRQGNAKMLKIFTYHGKVACACRQPDSEAYGMLERITYIQHSRRGGEVELGRVSPEV